MKDTDIAKIRQLICRVKERLCELESSQSIFLGTDYDSESGILLDEALALLPCKACNGTQQVGKEQFIHGRSIGWEECPDCQKKPIDKSS